MPALKKGSRVYLAGHGGLVGSAIHRALQSSGHGNIVTKTHEELDLLDQQATYGFLQSERPDVVIVAAAKVGGILANSERPADFIGENMVIESNLIWGSHLADVPNLLFLGSSCIYPRVTPQPIPEAALFTGPPEPTNAPYAVAKIAGLYLCDAISKQHGRNYFTVMPPNVFGPGDNFHPEHSHVIAALIRRFHEHLPDKTVTCWGTGAPKREFLHTDELADACLFVLGHEKVDGHVNVGTGSSITISELASLVQRVTGHSGEIEWDTSKPDGFPEKTMDVSRLSGMGWKAKRPLEDGLRDAYGWFKANVE